MVKVAVSASAPSAFAVTVYFVPEYGFSFDVQVVLASSKEPSSVEPSLPLTSTDARVPSVTVTSTGLVNAAFLLPSAGLTATTGFFVAADFADAVAAVSSVASADPLHPVSTAAGTTPSTVSTPRRDHLCDGWSDRFDMCETPTAGLPGDIRLCVGILRRADVVIL